MNPMGAGGYSLSAANSSGGDFGGGTLGGINFSNYKATDQNTLMIFAAVLIVAFVIVGKK